MSSQYFMSFVFFCVFEIFIYLYSYNVKLYIIDNTFIGSIVIVKRNFIFDIWFTIAFLISS